MIERPPSITLSTRKQILTYRFDLLQRTIKLMDIKDLKNDKISLTYRIVDDGRALSSKPYLPPRNP